MIIKSFEETKINLKNNQYFLLYGENVGFKNIFIKKNFEKKYVNNSYKYYEKDVLNDKIKFYDSIFSKSFFDNEKLIIISESTDKIKDIMEEIIEKNIPDIIIVINCGILEKKSKLRQLFEKEKKLVCIPFYADDIKTLSTIANSFFNEKKIPISQQNVNLIVDRCRGDRQNLNNELEKIENFTLNKKKN